MIRFAPRPGAAWALALALIALPTAAHATWLPNGTPLDSTSDYQWGCLLAPDGAGGAFAAWEHVPLHTSVQHLTAGGDRAPGWPAGGLGFGNGNDPQHDRVLPIALVPDDSGGVYVVTLDGPCGEICRYDDGMLFVRRLRADGSPAPGWTDMGVAVTDTLVQGFVRDALDAVPDGRGGLLLAWADLIPRSGLSQSATFAQAIGPRGERRWAGHFVRLGGPVNGNLPPAIVADGRGGALAFWADSTRAGGALGIRGQRIRADGSCTWASGGRAIAADTACARPLLGAIGDGGRGAIVAWTGLVRGRPNVLVTCLDEDGRARWGRAQVAGARPGGVGALGLVAARTGGAVVAWLQDRGGSGAFDVYAQRLDRNGRRRWGSAGVTVCGAAGTHGPLALAPADEDGAYVAWGDTRPAAQLYATRLTRRGEPAPGWAAAGAPVCGWAGLLPGPEGVEALALAAVSPREAIVSWTDSRFAEPGNPTLLDLSFAMLLTPRGPAAAPPGAAAKPVVPCSPVAGAHVAPAPALAIRAIAPNPASAGAQVAFALPDGAPAMLELFDVAGRRVWAREVGELGAGEHAVRLRDGAPSAPGLYLLRLRQGGRVASRRVVMLAGTR